MSQMQMRCSERNLPAIESCGGGPGAGSSTAEHGSPSSRGRGTPAISASVLPERSLQESQDGIRSAPSPVPLIPGSQGSPRSPRGLPEVSRHRAGDDGLQPALTNWQLHLSQRLPLHPSIHKSPKTRSPRRFSSLFLPGLPLRYEVLI